MANIERDQSLFDGHVSSRQRVVDTVNPLGLKYFPQAEEAASLKRTSSEQTGPGISDKYIHGKDVYVVPPRGKVVKNPGPDE